MNDTPTQPNPVSYQDDSAPVNSQSPFIGTMPQPMITPIVPPQINPAVPNGPLQQESTWTPPVLPTPPNPAVMPQPFNDTPPSPIINNQVVGQSPTPLSVDPTNSGNFPQSQPQPVSESTPPVVPVASVPQSPMHSWAGPQVANDLFPQNQFGSPAPISSPIVPPQTLDDLVPPSSPIPDDLMPQPLATEQNIVDDQQVESELDHLVVEKQTAEPSSPVTAQVADDVLDHNDSVKPLDEIPTAIPQVTPASMSTGESSQLSPSVPELNTNPTNLSDSADQNDFSADAVEGEVIPPAPAKGVLSSELMSIVEKYQVNQGKPHFPLNTLRLVYLIFAESIASDNQDLVKRRAEDILKIIPKVQELFDLRSSHRAENVEATLETEWQAVQEKLNEIYQIVDTPQIRQSAEFLFSYAFPLQDTLLLSLYEDIAGEKKFGVQDIYSIFHIRSMDSIFYSSLVGGIVSRDADPAQLPVNFQLAINYKLNALYQLNDLVDSIVYAKQDMESKNFSPFELVRKVAQDGTKAKELITSMAATFEKRIASFPLSERTEKLINDFGHQLVGVIGS